MSTRFENEGNIGSQPEFMEFPNDDPDEPDGLLRMRVYFDNSVRVDGKWEDKGGLWLRVDLRHDDVEEWQTLYQKGMRVLVRGKLMTAKWTDNEGREQTMPYIRAHLVAILPNRIAGIVMAPKPPATADLPE